MTPPSITLINYEVCSLQNTINKNINYSYWSKTQARVVHISSEVMKKQVKLLAHKTWHPMILEEILKDKSMK